MKSSKGKSLKKEPYILHEESKNKSIPFKVDSLCEIIFKTNLRKIIDERMKHKEFGFECLYQLKDKYTFDAVSKKMKDFIEKTPTGKKFKEKKVQFFSMLLSCLGWEFKRGIYLEAISNILLLPIPLFIKYFIDWLEKPEEDFILGVYYSLTLGVLYLVSSLAKFVQTDVNHYGRILGKAAVEVIKITLNFFFF